MFALKSNTRSTHSQNDKFNSQAVVDKILVAYKKLKKIAKFEISLKNKFKLANLTSNQLGQLKSIESNLGFCLVAYNEEDDFLGQKIQILTQINNLLNDYSKLLTKDDFSKFFE